MQYWGHEPIIVWSHDDPGLTLPILWQGQIWPLMLLWGKSKTMCFLGTIIDFVMKLASMGHSDKRYLVTSKLFTHAQGLYTCIKP